MSTDRSFRRSWLVTAALHEQGVRDAVAANPDVVILDLCEFVSERDKSAARAALGGRVELVATSHSEVFVQVDAYALQDDLISAVLPGVSGVVLTNAESPSDVVMCDRALASLEDAQRITDHEMEIVLALDTAKGNWSAYQMSTASERVSCLTLGRAELKMDLRPEPSGEIHLMTYLMQRLIFVASVSNRIPLGAWWRAPDRGLLATPERTLEAGLRGRAIGFRGSFCIMPDQVESLNRAFVPTEEELHAASDLLERFDTIRSEEFETLLVSMDAETVGEGRARQFRTLIERGAHFAGQSA